MFDKLKQISQARKIQSTLEKESLIGTAAGDMISVELNGKLEVIAVNIDPKLLTPENKSALENGIKEAFSNAHSQLQALMIEKFKSGEINL